MTTVDVSDDTMDMIEDIQKASDYNPAKKDIVGDAIERVHEIKVQGGKEEHSTTETN